MSKNYEARKIGVKALCRVSSKGGEGIYLYIPKKFADIYDLNTADSVEVDFVKAFYSKSTLAEPGVTDLTGNRKKRSDNEGEE